MTQQLPIDEFERLAVEVLRKKGSRCTHDGQHCVPMFSKGICHACLIKRKENTEKDAS